MEEFRRVFYGSNEATYNVWKKFYGRLETVPDFFFIQRVHRSNEKGCYYRKLDLGADGKMRHILSSGYVHSART